MQEEKEFIINSATTEHADTLKEAAIEYERAATDLNRFIWEATNPQHAYNRNMMLRNWFQVKHADKVFAIGRIINRKGSIQVEGGTGYAVQMAINSGKPVVIFDQGTKKEPVNKWKEWDGNGFVIVDTPVLTKDYAGIGTRDINDAGVQAIKDVYAKTRKAVATKDVVTLRKLHNIETPFPGVETMQNTGLTIDKSNEFIDLLQKEIISQAHIANSGHNANYMFSYGLRWAWKFPTKNEKSLQADAYRKEFFGKGKEYQRPDRVSINQKYDGNYAYYSTDQNNKPLPSMDELNPIKQFIEETYGIDLSNYDAMLANVYFDGSFINQHRDNTESKTAEGYEVVVLNLGSDGALYYDTNLYSGYNKYETKGELPLTNGGIYSFGADGVNRFKFHHRVESGLRSDVNPLKPIKLADDSIIENYRITLTFRRVQDLETGMPAKPAKTRGQQKPTLLPVTKKSKVIITPKNYTASTAIQNPKALHIYTENINSLDSIRFGAICGK